MKILEHTASLLSDPEVLQVLKSKGADGAGMGIKKAMASERIAYAYMNEHSQGAKTPEQLKEFLTAIEPYKLLRGEVLQLMNLAPTSAVEVHLVVEECEGRLSNEEVDSLLDLVAKHLRE